MKPALIFRHYIWLLNLLRCRKRLTLEEISKEWETDKMNDGNPLPRSTFSRYREAIEQMFGIEICCDHNNNYAYYIKDTAIMDGDSLKHWMLNTLTVGDVLANSVSIKHCIILENVPAGECFLSTLLSSIKRHLKLKVVYCRFEKEAREVELCPYAIKLWHQRWYLLADNGKHMSTYSLDRMKEVRMLNEEFEPNDDFDAATYLADYYGVLADNTPKENVRIRVYGVKVNYLRTLPLHTSQREVNHTKEYTDFDLAIRPTADFLDALMAYGDSIEVLEPASVRRQIKQRFADALKHYE